MPENIIAVAKIGKNVWSTDPNDYIFHSDYNTFKIIREASLSVTLLASTSDQTFSVAHGQDFIPLIDAFAKRDSASQVFKPNAIADVELWGPKLGMTGDVTFNFVRADSTHIYFNFDNDKGSNVDVTIRYFVLEAIE